MARAHGAGRHGTWAARGRHATPRAAALAWLAATVLIAACGRNPGVGGAAGVKNMSDDLKVEGSKIDLVRLFTPIDKAPGSFAIVTRQASARTLRRSPRSAGSKPRSRAASLPTKAARAQPATRP
jgi:hypothetical protein